MKTAIEELIEYIEEFQPKNKHTDGIWSKAKSLLETEKQHIIEAHNSGQNIVSIDAEFTDAETYYEQKYLTNKETLK